MKGVSFQKPLELKLEVQGERWRQGEAVRGVLQIKNLGSEAWPLNELGVALAHGHLKSVQTKASDAFEWMENRGFSESGNPPSPLEPGASRELAFEFATTLNAPVTDKSSSLYIVYGRVATPESARATLAGGSGFASLQLSMQPTPTVEELINQIQVHHKFVLKGIKAITGKKDAVEFKLEPPASRAYATLDHVLIRARYEVDGALSIHFTFVVIKIETPGVKGKVTFERTLSQADYQTSTGRIAFERLASVIREGLDLVESKLAF